MTAESPTQGRLHRGSSSACLNAEEAPGTVCYWSLRSQELFKLRWLEAIRASFSVCWAFLNLHLFFVLVAGVDSSNLIMKTSACHPPRRGPRSCHRCLPCPNGLRRSHPRAFDFQGLEAFANTRRIGFTTPLPVDLPVGTLTCACLL